VFLAVGESVGAGRAYAAQRGYTIDADQEMIALGGANLASGLFGGFTADASLSQTATAEAAGAKSQVSSLVTAGLILATILLLAPLFENLPDAVLGAIVIAATIGLINISEMRRYWRWRRADFALAMTAMVGVLLTTVLTGMMVAVLLSVLLLLYKASRPYVAVLGRMPGHAAGFGDVARHGDAEAVERLVIVRLDAPLYFFNANVAKTQIFDIVLAEDPAPKAILIDLAATADLDVTTTDMLFELLADLRARGIEVLVAQVKGTVRDSLRRTGLIDSLGEDRIFPSIPAAVADFTRRHPAGGPAAAAGAGAAGAAPAETTPAGPDQPEA
jgi:SulP family sulfate permease